MFDYLELIYDFTRKFLILFYIIRHIEMSVHLRTVDWILTNLLSEVTQSEGRKLGIVAGMQSASQFDLLIHLIYVAALVQSHKLDSIIANIEFHVSDDVGHQRTHLQATRSFELNHLSELRFHGLARRIMLLASSRGVLIFYLKNVAFEFVLDVKRAKSHHLVRRDLLPVHVVQFLTHLVQLISILDLS